MNTHDEEESTISTIREGFTMIELIFVILVIGILIAIALPRVSAVRDDAKLSTDISNMAVCIKDAGSQFVATGVNIASGDSSTCDNVKCYTITFATDVTDFIVATDPTGANYCANIDAVGDYLAKTYQFTGTTISF